MNILLLQLKSLITSSSLLVLLILLFYYFFSFTFYYFVFCELIMYTLRTLQYTYLL